MNAFFANRRVIIYYNGAISALMAEKGAKLKTLTELRQSSPAELDLLRRAYATIMES